MYRDGLVLATVDSTGTKYFHLDHLRTPRRITNGFRAVIASHDYYPFGEEITASSQDSEALKFTGHERDLRDPTKTTDDLDYMHARHYNPWLGRFLSVDPVGGSPAAPQSWNRYSYVRNNPLLLVDLDGRDVTYSSKKLQSFYEKAAANNWKVRQTLAAFAPGTGRNLHIQTGKPTPTGTGLPTTGSAEVHVKMGPNTPAMIDAYKAAGGGEKGNKAALAVPGIPVDVASATITVESGAAAQTKLHELGHVNQALESPAEFQQQAEEANQATTEKEYHNTASEVYADNDAEAAEKNEPDSP